MDLLTQILFLVLKLQKEGHAGLEVNSCGFFVSKTHGFLGASPDGPDGLVVDPSSENPSGLVEAKKIQLHELRVSWLL